MCLELTSKWIEVFEIGNLCINCALNIMRIMLEDIIAYHIGKRVSLLDIINHGDPDNAMIMFWLGKRFPEFHPEKSEEYNAMIEADLKYHSRVKKSDNSPESSIKKHDFGFCSICQERVDKWIGVYPFSILCIDCAQYTMRSMFEDIIEFYNDTPESLLEIMCYGNTKIDEMKAENKQIEEYLAARQLDELLEEQNIAQQAEKDCKTKLLFEFDNEKEESEK